MPSTILAESPGDMLTAKRLHTLILFTLAITLTLTTQAGAASVAPWKSPADSANTAGYPTKASTLGPARPVVAPTGDLPPYWHDFNTDSHEDLVARLSSTGDVHIYANSGNFDGDDTYSNQASAVALAGAKNLNWIGVGQFASGPYPDIVARTNDGSLVVYPNLEHDANPAQFGDPVKIGSGWNTLDSLNVADIDGDGYSDMVARRSNGDLVAYLHTGEFDATNTLGPPDLIGTGWNVMSWIGLGEVTEDGPGKRPDIVAIDPDGTLLIYPHKPFYNGTDSYYDPVSVGEGWQDVQPVAITDVNGDDFADLVALKDGQLVTYPNAGGFNGDNTFESPVDTGLDLTGIDLFA